MIRAIPNPYAVAFLGVIASGLMVLSACGNQAGGMASSSDEATLQGEWMLAHALDGNADANDCKALMETIHEGRAAVSATDEWKAFEATDEWQQVVLDGNVLHQLGCKRNDEFPGTLCLTMKQKIKDHFALAQATDEYKAASALQVWKDLANAYDEAREAHCLPSQRDEAKSTHEEAQASQNETESSQGETEPAQAG